MAQFIYNNSTTEITKVSPIYALYGYNPRASYETRAGPLNKKVILEKDQLLSLHEYIRKQLEFVNKRITTHYNKKRLKRPIFRRGDIVYLLQQNIQTTRPSDKLDYKKLRPFKVTRKISTSNYKLSLPLTIRIHPIFHISLLEPAPTNVPADDDVEIEANDKYKPERILGKRTNEGETQYLLK